MPEVFKNGSPLDQPMIFPCPAMWRILDYDLPLTVGASFCGASGPDLLPGGWKNRDTDMPMTIVMGERDGVVYFQSAMGTGIPAHELDFARPVPSAVGKRAR